MKRREFTLKIFYWGLSGGLFSLLGKSTFKGANQQLELTSNDLGQTITAFSGTVLLPEKPVFINSLFYLNLQKDSEIKLVANSEKISQSTQPLVLKRPGTYVIQYLGKEYGWSIQPVFFNSIL